MLELPLDGRPPRAHLIADGFYAIDVAARDDGRVVCTSHERVAIFDPVAGRSELFAYPWPKCRYVEGCKTWPQWISPDGRLMLRTHRGSIPRDEGAGADHPDLVADGQRRYGLALDIYETGPVKLRRSVVVRYVRSTEATAPLLDALADMQDHRTWDGASQLAYFAPLRSRWIAVFTTP